MKRMRRHTRYNALKTSWHWKLPTVSQSHNQCDQSENLSPDDSGLAYIVQIPLLEQAVDTGLQRSGRTRRLPVRFRDALPTSAVPVHLGQRHGARNQRSATEKDITEQQPPPDPRLQSDNEGIEDSVDSADLASTITNANSFGVFREYFAVSSHNPRNPDAFADIPIATATPQPQSIGSGLTVVASDTRQCHDPLTSSENKTTELLLAWMATGSGNTPTGMNDLVHNFIRHPDFDPSDLKDFNAITATRRFKWKHFPKPETTLKAGDGWKEGSVTIRVPCTRVKQKESEAPEFVVDGILYRDAVEVIESELKDPNAFKNIHIAPYKEWWCPRPDEDSVRVYSETFNSDTMLQADAKMRDSLGSVRGPQDNLETFIVTALLYSDSTHLASFGNASLWPIYLYLGNVSKYTCSKPTSFSAHHIAYIPTVCHHLPLMWFCARFLIGLE